MRTVPHWNVECDCCGSVVTMSGGQGHPCDGIQYSHPLSLNSHPQLLFSVSQPMRIERGGLVFDGVIGDLVPTGRQTDLTVGFTHQLNQDSTLRTAFTYTIDSKHYQGFHDTHVMLTYSGRF